MSFLIRGIRPITTWTRTSFTLTFVDLENTEMSKSHKFGRLGFEDEKRERLFLPFSKEAGSFKTVPSSIEPEPF